MRFNFYSPIYFENWDWEAVDRGIGGSETHHIEVVWRLARRGHEVWSYAPVPWKKGIKVDRGVKWLHLDNAKFTEPGIWITYRQPELADKFKKNKKQRLWIVLQDEFYNTWTKERADKFEKILALCKSQADNNVRSFPFLQNKVFIHSNGIRMDLIREVEKEFKVKRNPRKLIYASSPDRGLKNLIKVFKKAKEFVSDLELHVFYGFNNINKLIKFNKAFKHFKDTKEELLKLLKETKGVFWRGRIGQKELVKERLSAGLFVYPTTFRETSCISVLESQALGCIPIVSPVWALAENVKHGVFVQGDPNELLTQCRFAAEIVRLVSNPQLAEQIRNEMIHLTRSYFNWERWVDQIEAWALGIDNPWYQFQYAFQIKHAKGKILNVGCDVDLPNFGGTKGNVNVDILKESPITKQPTKAHVIADARNLPDKLFNRFDTVILGDLLEHYKSKDRVKMLAEATMCLKQDGCIVLTFPSDYRPIKRQHCQSTEPYSNTGSSTHDFPLTITDIKKDIKKVGLEIKLQQKLDYSFADGWGIIAS